MNGFFSISKEPSASQSSPHLGSWKESDLAKAKKEVQEISLSDDIQKEYNREFSKFSDNFKDMTDLIRKDVKSWINHANLDDTKFTEEQKKKIYIINKKLFIYLYLLQRQITYPKKSDEQSEEAKRITEVVKNRYEKYL